MQPLGDAQKETVYRNLLLTGAIVVIGGAGRSTAAGLPSFRGQDGLYSRASKGGSAKSAKDLMSYMGSFEPAHFRLMASMLLCASVAEPTAWHRLEASLITAGKMTRLYTQNIDGIELAALPAIDALQSKIVLMHGTLLTVRCQNYKSGGCRMSKPFLGPAMDYVETFARGEAPSCPSCLTRQWIPPMEKQSYRRSTVTRVPALRFDITLYEDVATATTAEPLEECSRQDRNLQRCKSLIIAGTSLGTPDAAKLARDFAEAPGRKSRTVLWVNTQPPPISIAPFVTHWLAGDIQATALALSKLWATMPATDTSVVS